MNFSTDQIMKWIQHYESFGPLPGFLLPLLEAFLPFLPLFAFVLANVNAFGLWLGFLISWGGAVTGSFIVFLLVRRFGQQRILTFLKRNKQVSQMMDWIDRHGFATLFPLLCFPFTPSAIINVVAGLSHISAAQYLFAIMAGKTVMIFTISYVGHDVFSLIHQPGKTAVIIVVMALLWAAGKQLEKRLQK
ncbi:TVP38/TMEM64 family protein [Domibacillus indicus]|uniref:TVP38/TMEM64 family protein n=1 Tax=Domibacillus indicus TaxID=1437523 RepID=UPI000617B3DB|nr:TVP38/TMEM64 family protein [Domibacillus indicus]